MRAFPGSSALAGALLVGLAAACLPGSGPPLNPYADDAGPPPSTDLGGDGSSSARADVDLGDPFAVTGLQPSHGPWTGATRATVAGRGFSSKLRVWIGATELTPDAVFASDPTRVAVVTPPGTPGPADVRVRNDATAQDRTLAAGFFYDAFVVEPSGGATSGGTRIALRGLGTKWTGASTVTVGGKACTDVSVSDATHLACNTPAASGPGAQDVTVTNSGGSIDQARDAFTYSDSPDGYRGGLYGGALSGNLKVLAFDNWTGAPLAGGKAIAGSNLAIVGTIGGSGVAALSDPSLAGKVTVTVAAKCHQPITFVDVPVDTVTAYLNPVLDLSCAHGDPPSTGGFPTTTYGEIDGELVWQGGQEFQRGGWTNVPEPQNTNERRAAYVFVATGSPLDSFDLPPKENATTPDSPGQRGYQYRFAALPGNRTLYALAGIENRAVTPPTFAAYAMGVARGVAVQPGVQTVQVDVPMTTVLDHVVTTAPVPPAPTMRGPDRLVSLVAVTVGQSRFAILPQGSTTTLLPVAGDVKFVGVPALDATLSGESYNLTAMAVTGSTQSVPLSVVTRVRTTDANDPVAVGGFVAVPTFGQPGAGTWSGAHVSFGAAGTIDVAVIDVTSGGGLVDWRIVAPGSATSFDLPDLAQLPGVGKLVHGSISTSIAVARIDSFDYGTLRYGQLYSGGWNAYAMDVIRGAY